MKLTIGKITGFVFLFCFFVEPFFVFAQEGSLSPEFSFAPSSVELSVLPGEKTEGKIKIKNTGKLSLFFNLELVNFTAEKETGKMLVDNEIKGGLRDWIKFQEDKFTIEPGEVKEIFYQINIPPETKPGGYYALAVFNSAVEQLVINDAKNLIFPGWGVTFSVSVEGQDRLANPIKVEEFKVINENEKWSQVNDFFSKKQTEQDKTFFQIASSSQPEFLIKIRNVDAYHTKLKGEIILESIGTKEKIKIDLPSITILPGKTRILKIKGDSKNKNSSNELEEKKNSLNRKELKFPLVKTTLDIKKETSEKETLLGNKKAWLLILNWKNILFLGLILFIIIWIIFILNNKKRKFFILKALKISKKYSTKKIKIFLKNQKIRMSTRKYLKFLTKKK